MSFLQGLYKGCTSVLQRFDRAKYRFYRVSKQLDLVS